jgi:hypothetical protein
MSVDEKLEQLRQGALALALTEEQRKTMTASDLRTYALDSLCKTIGGARGVDERLPGLRKECLEWETVNSIREQHEFAVEGLQGAKALRDKLCEQACSIPPFSSMPGVSASMVLNLAMHMDKIDTAASRQNPSHKCMKQRATLLRLELDGIERCIKVAETLSATV